MRSYPRIARTCPSFPSRLLNLSSCNWVSEHQMCSSRLGEMYHHLGCSILCVNWSGGFLRGGRRRSSAYRHCCRNLAHKEQIGCSPGHLAFFRLGQKSAPSNTISTYTIYLQGSQACRTRLAGRSEQAKSSSMLCAKMRMSALVDSAYGHAAVVNPLPMCCVFLLYHSRFRLCFSGYSVRVAVRQPSRWANLTSASHRLHYTGCCHSPLIPLL